MCKQFVFVQRYDCEFEESCPGTEKGSAFDLHLGHSTVSLLLVISGSLNGSSDLEIGVGNYLVLSF